MGEIYNNETILAIEETDKMLKNQCDAKTYNSFEEVLNEVFGTEKKQM